MPLKMFWTLCNNIQRIQARDDLRRLSISSTAAMAGGFAGSIDALRDLNEQLTIERGTVVKTKFDPIREAQLDRAGLESLRSMSGSTRKMVISSE